MAPLYLLFLHKKGYLQKFATQNFPDHYTYIDGERVPTKYSNLGDYIEKTDMGLLIIYS